MSSVSESTNSLRREFAVRQSVADWTILSLLRPLHVVLAAPSLLFIATLAIMLFRPPDVQFHSLDRIAFLALIFVVLLRTLATQERFQFAGPVTLPMLGLLLNCIFAAYGWNRMRRRIGVFLRQNGSSRSFFIIFPALFLPTPLPFADLKYLL